MTLVIGPNLSIDQTVAVPRLRIGTIHRVPAVHKLAGGKGANVARAMRILGEDPLLLGFAGGPVGEQLAAYLRADGIAHRLVPSQGETRVCFSVADDSTGEQTEFYEGGAPVSTGEIAALLAAADAAVPGHRWVVLTGSLPRGAPADLYAQLMAIARRHGARVLLDAKGAALAAGIIAGPDLLKVNRAELAEHIGRALDTPTQVAEAARAALDGRDGRDGASAIITLGAGGAVVVDALVRWLIVPPSIRARSPVGSGDSVAAGVVAALDRGQLLLEAARLGVAAGAANAQYLGGAQFTRADVEALLPRCAVMALSTG